MSVFNVLRTGAQAGALIRDIVVWGAPCVPAVVDVEVLGSSDPLRAVSVVNTTRAGDSAFSYTVRNVSVWGCVPFRVRLLCSTPPAPPAPVDPPGPSSLPKGAIVGAAAGGALALSLLGCALYFCWRRRRQGRSESASRLGDDTLLAPVTMLEE